MIAMLHHVMQGGYHRQTRVHLRETRTLTEVFRNVLPICGDVFIVNGDYFCDGCKRWIGLATAPQTTYGKLGGR